MGPIQSGVNNALSIAALLSSQSPTAQKNREYAGKAKVAEQAQQTLKSAYENAAPGTFQNIATEAQSTAQEARDAAIRAGREREARRFDQVARGTDILKGMMANETSNKTALFHAAQKLAVQRRRENMPKSKAKGDI